MLPLHLFFPLSPYLSLVNILFFFNYLSYPSLSSFSFSSSLLCLIYIFLHHWHHKTKPVYRTNRSVSHLSLWHFFIPSENISTDSNHHPSLPTFIFPILPYPLATSPSCFSIAQKKTLGVGDIISWFFRHWRPTTQHYWNDLLVLSWYT